MGEPRDAVENLISGFGPNEGLRIGVMRIDKFANRRLQLGHAAVDAAPQLFVGERSEPALDQVQPRAVRRREVDVEARPLREPISNHRRLVGAVVVHDQMDVEVPRDGGIDGVQELPELRRAMPLMELGISALVFTLSAANNVVVPWRR